MWTEGWEHKTSVVLEGEFWHAEGLWKTERKKNHLHANQFGVWRQTVRPSLIPLSMPGTSWQLWPSWCHRNTDHYQNNRSECTRDRGRHRERGRESRQRMIENVWISINVRRLWFFFLIIQAWSDELGLERFGNDLRPGGWWENWHQLGTFTSEVLSVHIYICI